MDGTSAYELSKIVSLNLVVAQPQLIYRYVNWKYH